MPSDKPIFEKLFAMKKNEMETLRAENKKLSEENQKMAFQLAVFRADCKGCGNQRPMRLWNTEGCLLRCVCGWEHQMKP